MPEITTCSDHFTKYIRPMLQRCDKTLLVIIDYFKTSYNTVTWPH